MSDNGRGRFYITTPIYYTNGIAHLGHVFEVVGIDVQARYRRMVGHEVYFLTGTDEHGQKIQNSAEKRGITPQALVDELAAQFKTLWAELGITNDDFIRTSEARHHAGVHKIWKTVKDKGYIYRDKYEGWYDSRNEAYITETEMAEQGITKDDPFINWTSEENWFFRLSDFQEQIENLLENTDFVQPEHRAREMLNSFVKPGLNDLCISRATIDWGIPVPDDAEEVVYVWFDALTNYLSAIGYGTDDEWTNWWPANVHVIGKDILKFHTIIWPAMLMAAEIELPKQVYGHGFITLHDAKMSKSDGNFIDPRDLLATYGVDTLRYFLMREFNYGGDGAFVEENLRTRFNADLANGIGNLVSRSFNLIEKSLGGELVLKSTEGEAEQEVVKAIESAFGEYESLMEGFEYNRALALVWEAITKLDLYITNNAPWKLAKDPDKREELETCLYTCAEGVRCVASLLQPFMPTLSAEIWKRLGLGEAPSETAWAEHKKWGMLQGGEKIVKGDALFPRLEK